jgi:hypothetical protein
MSIQFWANVEVRRPRAKIKTPNSKTNSQSEGCRPAPFCSIFSVMDYSGIG